MINLTRIIDAEISYDGNNLVVLTGVVNGTTELSSYHLCICINIEKQSIFEGIVQVHDILSRNKNILHYLFIQARHLYEYWYSI